MKHNLIFGFFLINFNNMIFSQDLRLQILDYMNFNDSGYINVKLINHSKINYYINLENNFLGIWENSNVFMLRILEDSTKKVEVSLSPPVCLYLEEFDANKRTQDSFTKATKNYSQRMNKIRNQKSNIKRIFIKSGSTSNFKYFLNFSSESYSSKLPFSWSAAYFCLNYNREYLIYLDFLPKYSNSHKIKDYYPYQKKLSSNVMKYKRDRCYETYFKESMINVDICD